MCRRRASGIYLIINHLNGRYYVGRSSDWKGKRLPPEMRAKLSEGRRDKVPVECSNGKLYTSQQEAARSLGLKQGHISEVVNGHRPLVKGLKFWKRT